MNKYCKIILAVLVCMGSTFSFEHTAFSHVLQGRHIIDLSVKKAGTAANIVVKQSVTLPLVSQVHNQLNGLNPGASHQPIMEQDIDPQSSGNAAPAPGEIEDQVEETVYYGFNNQIRSEIDSDDIQKITLFANAETAEVIDGHIVSRDEAPLDIYKKILLFRNPHMLESYLTSLGVNVEVSSLGRLSGRIVYIIGANYPDASVAQIWFDKDTFLPVRCLVKGSMDDFETLEILFSHWIKTEKLSYPMRVAVNKNGIPSEIIHVTSIVKNAKLSDDLFSIKVLNSLYPPSGFEAYKNIDEPSDVEKSIDNFKKMFE